MIKAKSIFGMVLAATLAAAFVEEPEEPYQTL
jgi:hypothetical protein